MTTTLTTPAGEALRRVAQTFANEGPHYFTGEQVARVLRAAAADVEEPIDEPEPDPRPSACEACCASRHSLCHGRVIDAETWPVAVMCPCARRRHAEDEEDER